jgi:hypothetical protein
VITSNDSYIALSCFALASFGLHGCQCIAIYWTEAIQQHTDNHPYSIAGSSLSPPLSFYHSTYLSLRLYPFLSLSMPLLTLCTCIFVSLLSLSPSSFLCVGLSPPLPVQYYIKESCALEIPKGLLFSIQCPSLVPQA